MPGKLTAVSLKSLAPRYVESQHGGYLRRLESAAQDPKNRNIALSGRCGTGKSSVLDKFEENQKDSTLRLAISTLAPDGEGASLTNRIKKELASEAAALQRLPSHAAALASTRKRCSSPPWERSLTTAYRSHSSSYSTTGYG